MRSSRSRKFRLIPAMAPEEGTVSPASFFPAIPVDVGQGFRQEYATLDVSLQISRISAEILEHAQISSPQLEHPSSPQGLVLLHLPLTVRDQDMQPWLHFPKVPFSISKDLGTGINPSRLVLGSRGFLDHLRISFNFPKKTMTITSPSRFLVASPSSRSAPVPTSLAQAEDLIEAGSFTSAVVLATTGLEQTILSSTYSLYPSSSSSARIPEILNRTAFDPALSSAVLQMYEIRNRAVHGAGEDRISEADAREVLSTARRVIQKAHQSA